MISNAMENYSMRFSADDENDGRFKTFKPFNRLRLSSSPHLRSSPASAGDETGGVQRPILKHTKNTEMVIKKP